MEMKNKPLEGQRERFLELGMLLSKGKKEEGYEMNVIAFLKLRKEIITHCFEIPIEELNKMPVDKYDELASQADAAVGDIKTEKFRKSDTGDREIGQKAGE